MSGIELSSARTVFSKKHTIWRDQPDGCIAQLYLKPMTALSQGLCIEGIPLRDIPRLKALFEPSDALFRCAMGK